MPCASHLRPCPQPTQALPSNAHFGGDIVSQSGQEYEHPCKHRGSKPTRKIDQQNGKNMFRTCLTITRRVVLPSAMMPPNKPWAIPMMNNDDDGDNFIKQLLPDTHANNNLHENLMNSLANRSGENHPNSICKRSLERISMNMSSRSRYFQMIHSFVCWRMMASNHATIRV